MRLWSLHPKYLDVKGLVALWREGILARTVLCGKSKGYKNHPQLQRFRKHENPILALDSYMIHVYKESVIRGYKFNREKIGHRFTDSFIDVTDQQLSYELEHLKSKLLTRDPELYFSLENLKLPDPNPFFRVVKGKIEVWEVIKTK